MLVALYRSAALDQDELVFDLISPPVEKLLGSSGLALRGEDETELVEASLRFALCLPLDQLIDHGALQLSGPGSSELETAPKRTGGGLPTRVVVMASSSRIRTRLTPLGRWGLREALLAEGAEAPAPGADRVRPDVITLGVTEFPSSAVDRY
jgi:hypothetical protein